MVGVLGGGLPTDRERMTCGKALEIRDPCLQRHSLEMCSTRAGWRTGSGWQKREEVEEQGQGKDLASESQKEEENKAHVLHWLTITAQHGGFLCASGLALTVQPCHSTPLST